MDAIAQLEWIPPSESSLLTLARQASSCAWPVLRRDPGLVLLILQSHAPSLTVADSISFPELIGSPEVLERAVRCLGNQNQAMDWSRPGLFHIHQSCLCYAQQAERLARLTTTIDSELAWVSGLLAPLGWLAVSSIEPEQFENRAADPQWLEDPRGRFYRQYRTEPGSIARRLCRIWKLPDWYTAIATCTGLGVGLALKSGADPELFQLVQLAIALAQQSEPLLRMPVGTSISTLLHNLSISVEALAAPPDEQEVPEMSSPPVALWELLGMAAENARLKQRSGHDLLEQEIDILHKALEDQCQSEAERLHDLKLSALAEMAAGAGHEINNPLAVISGQAQYLLRKTTETLHRRSLETIVGQTERIHRILRSLMQFARPSPPVKKPLDLLRLVDEVGVSLVDYAEARKVTLRSRPEDQGKASAPVMVEGDPGQLKTVLASLFRNAIEAAGSQGSVRVSIAHPRLPSRSEMVEVQVENSGPRLTPTEREHLFDPFYSGRSAGRGVGLGLPTAWALARSHGGDVKLVSQGAEPTCFVLQLPLPEENAAIYSACG